MAYVALSRVRSLSGPHLSAFDSQSIKVSIRCLKDVNRLREIYRKDLSVFSLPAVAKISKKRKLMSRDNNIEAPNAKKAHSVENQLTSQIISNCYVRKILPQIKQTMSGEQTETDQLPSSETNTEICFQSNHDYVNPLKYYQVTEMWQRNACLKLHLSFVKTTRVSPGGPTVPLGPPNPYNIKPIVGDGNCLFRCFSYVITGSEDQHMEIRNAIVNHMYHIAPFLIGPFITEHTINDYIQNSGMDQCKTWGTYVEILTFCHLLQTSVLSYNMANNDWARYCPHGLDKNIVDNFTKMSIYL